MSNHQPVWEEWQKASLYGMLAELYEYNEPEWSRYYRQMHTGALTRLAALVRQYGVPLAGEQTQPPGWGAGPATAIPGLGGPPGWNMTPAPSASQGTPDWSWGQPVSPHAHYSVHGAGSAPWEQQVPAPSSASWHSPPMSSPAPAAYSTWGSQHGLPGHWGGSGGEQLPGWPPSPASRPPIASYTTQKQGTTMEHSPPGDGGAIPSSTNVHMPEGGALVPREPAPVGKSPDHVHEADETAVPPAYIRLLNVLPGAGPLELRLGGIAAVQPLPYLQASSYIEVRPGSYSLELRGGSEGSGSGLKRPPLLSSSVQLSSGASITAAAGGTSGEPELFMFQDEQETANDRTRIRLLHLAASRSPVDVMVRDGGTLFRHVPYGGSSPYITLSPAELELELTESGTLRTLLASPPLNLQAAQAASLVFAGDKKTELILLPDGQ